MPLHTHPIRQSSTCPPSARWRLSKNGQGGRVSTPSDGPRPQSVSDIEAAEPVRWAVNRVGSTGSTNTDLLRAAEAGAPEGSVLVADEQTAGLGRLGRTWLTPPGAALAVSVVLRPPVVGSARADRLGWVPLLTGLAVRDAVMTCAPGLAVGLKWPNDVLAERSGAPGSGGPAKLGGILVQAARPAETGLVLVVGIGLNVSVRADQFPAGVGATSLSMLGAAVGRDELLDAVLERLGARYAAWRAGTDARTDYLAVCLTLGQSVRVTTPGGEVTGVATDVDATGRLVVTRANGTSAVAAGDVTHLRTESR